MPDVLHSTLAGSESHEPKGASTATANQVYISDGAGSGAWTNWPLGWGHYKDNATAQNITTTPTLLSIDGLGSSTNESYLPQEIRGSGSLWDATNDKITPIAEGDTYNLRLDLPVTAEAASPTELTLEFDINGSTYVTRITIVERYIGTGKAVPYTVSVGFPVFIGSTAIANGIQIWAYTDTGNLDITQPSITIVRTSSGNI